MTDTKSRPDDGLETLLAQILDLPDVERPNELERLCAARPDLADQLRTAWQRMATIERPAAEIESDRPESVGPYRILGELGTGGMGVVYLAEQREPVRRLVALKVIKLGMDSRQVLGRFELERQTLAVMNHPAIAKVFDAGISAQGQPYFAMELVEGVPITDYCDQHRLTIEERIGVFQRLCQGVQHAHHKGILHRDLKPANVLVSRKGDEHVVKIIDFGLARATDQQMVDHTILTVQGQVIGTPEYMSPEQAGGNPLDVDTRTDTYSLGVVLYELLTGSRPFEGTELRRVGLMEMQRILREQDPHRPSTRVSSLGQQLVGAARCRRITPSALRRNLRGELDWIVLRAMAKEPERRYGSPSELAADLGRYLAHEPVLAGPPSASYRVRKLLRRYRGHVAAAALVFLSLVAGVILSTVYSMEAQAAQVEAERNAREATQIADFLERLFEQANPTQSLGEELSVREIIDRGAARIRTELGGQPALRARLMVRLGRVYLWLDEHTRAADLFESAIEIATGAVDADMLNHWKILRAEADVYRGRVRESEQVARRELHRARAELGPDHEFVGVWAWFLSYTLHHQGRTDEAEGHLREAIPILRRKPGTVLADALGDLAVALHNKKENTEARGYFEEAIRIYEKESPNGHPKLTHWRQCFSLCLIDLRDLDAAEHNLLRCREEAQRYLGAAHRNVAVILRSLASLRSKQHRYKEAIVFLRQAVTIQEKKPGPALAWTLADLGSALRKIGELEGSKDALERAIGLYEKAGARNERHYAVALSTLAWTQRALGDLRAAQTAARRSLALLQGLSSEPDLNVVLTTSQLSDLCAETGDLEEAESLARQAVDLAGRLVENADWERGSRLRQLAWILNKRGRWEEAERTARESIEILSRIQTESEPLAYAWFQVGWACMSQNRMKEAEAGYRTSVRLFRHLFADGHFLLAHGLVSVAVLCRERDPDEFLRLLTEAVAVGRKHLRPDSPDLLRWTTGLGEAHTAKGQFDRAEPLLLETYARIAAQEGPQRTATLKALADLYGKWERPEEAARYRDLLSRDR